MWARETVEDDRKIRRDVVVETETQTKCLENDSEKLCLSLHSNQPFHSVGIHIATDSECCIIRVEYFDAILRAAGFTLRFEVGDVFICCCVITLVEQAIWLEGSMLYVDLLSVFSWPRSASSFLSNDNFFWFVGLCIRPTSVLKSCYGLLFFTFLSIRIMMVSLLEWLLHLRKMNGSIVPRCSLSSIHNLLYPFSASSCSLGQAMFLYI